MKESKEKEYNNELPDASLRNQVWKARKAEITEKNSPMYENEEQVRKSGFGKIIRSVTWGPVVNAAYGGVWSLVGLSTIASGLGKGLIGFIEKDQERKKDSIELLKVGVRQFITGITAPVTGIFSDLYDGCHRIFTGKRALTTLESEFEVQRVTMLAADDKERFIRRAEEDIQSEKLLQERTEKSVQYAELSELTKKGVEAAKQQDAIPQKIIDSLEKQSQNLEIQAKNLVSKKIRPRISSTSEYFLPILKAKKNGRAR